MRISVVGRISASEPDFREVLVINIVMKYFRANFRK